MALRSSGAVGSQYSRSVAHAAVVLTELQNRAPPLSKVTRAALTDLANTLREQGAIDETESYIDATFASAKGGGDEIGPTKRGKGVKIVATVARQACRLRSPGTPRIIMRSH
jgi:hypothetical protein